MKRQWLHDAAKVGTGLVAADFIILWWYTTIKVLPATFLGLPIYHSMLLPAIVVDVFLIIMLVHYGWHIGKIPQIKERMYLTVAGIVFSLVAVAHLIRILYQGDVVLFGWDVPVFLSWIGVAVATYLAYSSFHFAGRLKR